MPDAICGIYAIEDREKRVYIGSSVNIRRRWREHAKALQSRKHHNPKLQQAWSQRGPDFFEWRVLQYVERESELNRFEQYWIDVLGPWYNVALVADRPVVSEEKRDERRRSAMDRYLRAEIEWQQRYEDALKKIARLSEIAPLVASRFPDNVPPAVAAQFIGYAVRAKRGQDPWDIDESSDIRVYEDRRHPIVELAAQPGVDKMLRICENLLQNVT